MFRAVARLPIFVVSVLSISGNALARDLSFEERVAAQKVVERVYYSHQIGTTTPFEEAVPHQIVEDKVRTYLKQSVALTQYWKTPVTAEMLQAETDRILRNSRMPGRLEELFNALDRDAILFQECVARPILVNRLARNFQGQDQRIQGARRAEADSLRRGLLVGTPSIWAEEPHRALIQVDGAGPTGSTRGGLAPVRHPADPKGNSSQSLQDADGIRKWRSGLPRAAGDIGPLNNGLEAYSFEVVLVDTDESLQVAEYTFPKITWDTWWAESASGFDERGVHAVVADSATITFPAGTASAIGGQELPEATVETAVCRAPDTWDSRFSGDIPEGRMGHTAVWTGTLMLIWGGQQELGGYAGTGGRYDPATDTWSQISIHDASLPASFQTVVWTGREMIVWGGWRPGANITPFGGGGRYDPLLDRWTQIYPNNVVSARYGHSAVWTGQYMVIWGGTQSINGPYLENGGRYEPSTDTWTAVSTSGAPSARGFHVAVWTGNRMLVWGGLDLGGQLSSGGRYEPSSNTWSPISTTGAPPKRFSRFAIWTGTEMIYWGGVDASQLPVETGGRYNPITDTWSPISDLNAPTSDRFQGTAIWTGTQMIVAGQTSQGMGRYDPIADQWVSVSATNAPSSRVNHTAIWTGTLMIVWGGREATNPYGPFLDTGARYDPLQDSWTPTSPGAAPRARAHHSAVWTGNEMVVWGGWPYPISSLTFSSGGRYDPATDSWEPTSTANAPMPRVGHTAVWAGNRMIVWGGEDASGFLLDSGGSYDPVADQWTATTQTGAPSARFEHTAVWTGNRMVVWGGLAGPATNASIVTGSGGLYDPATDSWEATETAGAPEARAGHTAAWAGDSMIVWGGAGVYASGYLRSGSRFDPVSNSWAPISEVNAPNKRAFATAIWTGRVMIVWGGSVDILGYNTGGRYDPATDTWAAISTTGAPERRQGYSTVWTGKEMIVWGGTVAMCTPNCNLNVVDSGGRYDPANDSWTATSRFKPPLQRTGHSAVWTGLFMLVWGGDIEVFGATNTGGGYSLGCQPPVAVTNVQSEVECDTSGGAMVQLDGSESNDPNSVPGLNDDIASYHWSLDGNVSLGFGERLESFIPLGHHQVTLEVTDAEGLTASTSSDLSVVDTTGPAISCPRLARTECTSQAGGPIGLAASATDLCGGPVTLENDRTSGGADASGIYPLGTSTVTFTATDARDNVSTCSAEAAVQDTQPPQFLAFSGPTMLWPPNHRMADVHFSVAVTDACSSPSLILTSVSSSESDDVPGSGDGSTSGDVQGAEVGSTDFDLQLRVERDGNGSGRIYGIAYAAVDGSGNTSQAHGFVMVPHDVGGSTEPFILSVQESLTGTFLSWDPVPGAKRYEVIRGNVRSLQVAGDFINLGTVTCIRSGSSETSTGGHEDGQVPAIGEAFFYLSAYNDGHDSGYGSASATKPRMTAAAGCD